MENASFAAQSVADGPMTAAQPSFNGQGWLVVANLGIMTAAALIMLMLVIKLVSELAYDRDKGPLVALLRSIMLILFAGMMVRTGVEALTLWGWNPLEPERTGWYNSIKRMLDPFGAAAYIAGGCAYHMTEGALTEGLRRKPFPERLVATLPRLRRPAMLALSTLVAAILVVSLR